MANRDVTIIRVRRGIPGKAKYCACDNKGNPLRGFNKLSDVRMYWQKEIRWGHVQLVRELDKQPDFTVVRETKDILENILNEYGKKKSNVSNRADNDKPSVISNLRSNEKVIRQLEKNSERSDRSAKAHEKSEHGER